MARRGVIRVGVAGWDYADWDGTVYPAGGGRRLDRLAYISRYVDLVEINNTFYRPIAPRVAESWAARTRARGESFRFAAKSHRSWTHDADLDAQRDIPATLRGLRPLHEANRLSALLVQFPQSFRYGRAARERLRRIAEGCADWPVVAEMRHAGWQTEEATRWFRTLGIAWCVVDQPRVGRSTARPAARVTSRLAYLRLHGRNRADWFRRDAGRDARYDYLYALDELRELAATAEQMSRGAEELIVVQNNHFRGQALANALQMKHLLEGQRPRAPESLADTYPALRSHVVVERSRLF